MDPVAELVPLAIALGCGAIIGLERGWSDRAKAPGTRVAGIRTFSLLGLLGGAAGLLSTTAAPWPLAAAILAAGLLIGLGYWRGAAVGSGMGLTTEVASVLTVLLGGTATMGHPLPAAMASVVTALILSVKPFTHRLLERIEEAEIQATLRLLLISVVILPVLPDQGYGPYQALNPFKLWLMVVALSGLSFLGYVAMRLGDARQGILFTGVFGGIVSSTATTLALSRIAARQPGFASIIAAGALTAWLVMCARIGLITYLLDPGLAIALALPLGAMALVGLALMLWFVRRRPAGDMERADLGNPFEFWSAVRFAGLLAAIMLASRWVEDRYGATGLDVLGIISGLADVDAITLSIASGAQGRGISEGEAAQVILLAAVTNNLVKAGLGTFAGGRAIATRLIPAAIAMTIAALGVAFVA
ncbi:MgtC/SapB family protein [Oleomonas cavernae]|uniref:MgtC/SapB family protein n=1 Tax=Oleomonas cavernae TaxID=2320859 RepID=A0A418W9S3_9PROT|nr:MgtC/SapB family protein [Oleomonas cavernae]RJF86694.1 MgtC/SapB family protein [Oleomonas cavernae]